MPRTLIALASLSLLSLAAPAQAQDWPNRPMTMVVPFAAGGAVDVLGRTIGARAAEILGQQIVIENVGGAGGMTGSNRVAKAAPDGYQFVLGSVGTHAQNQTLYKHPAYSVVKEFEPVILVGETPLLLVTRKDIPANEPAGVHRLRQGQSRHVEVRLGRRRLGDPSRLRAVQRRGRHRGHAHSLSRRQAGDAGPDRRPDRLRLQHHHQRLSAGARQADQGAGQPVGAGARRCCPTSPTAQEQGMAGFDAGSWNVVFLPKGTPQPIVNKLNAAFNQALDSPETEKRLLAHGIDIPAKDRRSPAYAGKFVQSEIKKYEGPIKASGIVIE